MGEQGSASEERTMVILRNGARGFSVRVCALIMHRGKVLIHRAETDDSWVLPGGRLELMESTAEATKREMAEELGEDVEVGRLLWVVENFFDAGQDRWQEIGFYYEVTLPAGCELYNMETFTRTEEFFPGQQSLKLIFEWRSIDELKGLVIYPLFLPDELGALPETTKHVVIVE